MYLLDTNIWLERLLAREHSEEVGEFLDTVPADQLFMSDFTFHSIGVILGRLKKKAVFTRFVQDVLIDGGITMVSLAPSAMRRVVAVMDQYRLDFDDAYQYVVSERENAITCYVSLSSSCMMSHPALLPTQLRLSRRYVEFKRRKHWPPPSPFGRAAKHSRPPTSNKPSK